MKDTLAFTAAFIITAKVYRDVLTTVGHSSQWDLEKQACLSQLQWQEDTGKVKRGQSGLMGSRPLSYCSGFLCWIKTRSLALYWRTSYCILKYDPFAIDKCTFGSPHDYCKISTFSTLLWWVVYQIHEHSFRCVTLHFYFPKYTPVSLNERESLINLMNTLCFFSG